MKDTIFIKYGGSLITEKDKPFTAKKEVIHQLADEFIEIKERFPQYNFVLGHGSGSFGHKVGSKYKTRKGVKTKEEWAGFIKVWMAAKELNRIVIEIFNQKESTFMAFPPSSILNGNNGQVNNVFLDNIHAAHATGITPFVFGDVIFDEALGGTIFSTEDVFFSLIKDFSVKKIMISGLESAIYKDYPKNEIPIVKITPNNYELLKSSIQGSKSTDVTGGMFEKVRIMLNLVEKYPNLIIHVFSGEEKGNFLKILNNTQIGTSIERE